MNDLTNKLIIQIRYSSYDTQITFEIIVIFKLVSDLGLVGYYFDYSAFLGGILSKLISPVPGFKCHCINFVGSESATL